MKLSRDIRIELQNLCRENNVSFFCGAGISFNSGIPIVASITYEIINVLLEDNAKAKDLHSILNQSKRPFEAFMQTVINLSGDDQLLDIFKLGSPNTNHFLLGHLCKAGHIKEIFTTNFDLLIENAFQKVGLEKDKDYLVFSNEKEFKKGLALTQKHDTRIMLFKLHGSIHDKKSIRTTLESIGRRDWLTERSRVVQYAFGDFSNSVAIIQGYSFSDFFDINAVLSNIIKPKAIFYVEHFKEISNGKLSDLKSVGLSSNLTNTFTGKKITVNNNQLTEFIWHLKRFPKMDNRLFYKKTTTDCKRR